MITINDIEKAREICRKIARCEQFDIWCNCAKFTYTNESNHIVYERIKGHEFETPVFFYNQPKRLFRALIVGYSDRKGIHVNTSAVKTLPELVGNICHESLHQIGYSHPFFNTKTRPSSVPYLIGSLFRNEASKYV